MNHLTLDLLLIGKVKYQFNIGMGLLDYGYFIKNPMDLGTVSNKLKDNRYDHVEEVFDDLQLIWDNCKTYNSPDTVHSYLLSGFIMLLKNWKDLLRKWQRTIYPTLPLLSLEVNSHINLGSNPNQKEDKRPSHNTVFEEDENEEVTYH